MPRTAVAVVLSVLAAGCSSDSADRRAPVRSAEDVQKLVLRPSDLPRGYQYGDDSVCGVASAEEGDWRALRPLFRRERPSACINELAWVWAGEPPYSHGIQSAAYAFRDEAAARRGFAVREELVTFTATLAAAEREAVELGDEAELLRGDGLNDAASGVVWRYGNVVAVLVVEPASDEAARELAERQQERLERPKPLAPADHEEDTALQLDDPSLKLPVYWLGSTFDPPGDLPPLELDLAAVGGTGPGQSVQLWYGSRGDVPDTVSFDTYELEVWEEFRRTRLGRLIWDSPCARKKVVPVDGGVAEIFHGYGSSRPVQPPCPAGPRNRVVAHVYYEEIVVVVNLPYCYGCARPESPPSPFETVEATETLVRALRPRP